MGKENKKKKKKSKKEKESEEEEEEKEQKEEEVPEHKPLVPYEEAEEPKTNEESVDEDATEKSEKEEEKPSIDPTKFINSFSETVVEEVKPKLKLPTLIFNEKTVELAPRAETKSEPEQQVGGHKANDQEVKKGSDSFADSARTQAMVVESWKTKETFTLYLTPEWMHQWRQSGIWRRASSERVRKLNLHSSLMCPRMNSTGWNLRARRRI